MRAHAAPEWMKRVRWAPPASPTWLSLLGKPTLYRAVAWMAIREADLILQEGAKWGPIGKKGSPGVGVRWDRAVRPIWDFF